MVNTLNTIKLIQSGTPCPLGTLNWHGDSSEVWLEHPGSLEQSCATVIHYCIVNVYM